MRVTQSFNTIWQVFVSYLNNFDMMYDCWKRVCFNDYVLVVNTCKLDLR